VPRTSALALTLLTLTITACEDTAHRCGPFVYSPEEGRCTCPPGWIENEEFTGCISLDAGPPPTDAAPATDDAGNCVPEECNGEDDDCDGATDESGGPMSYPDTDGDGDGDAARPTTACDRNANPPEGHVLAGTDCDDTRSTVRPGSSERCNGLDDDCDGMTDETGVCPEHCRGGTIGVNEYLACISIPASGQPASWSEADSTCRSLGYRLASVETSEEQAALAASEFMDPNERHWLGGSDQTVADDWTWPTGVVFWRGDRLGAPVGGAYTNWEPNHPIDGANCASVTFPDGRWQSYDCIQDARILCER
jgi:hypothetical protein